MTWASWLLSIVGPLAVRVLSVLGLSVVTFTGVSTVVSDLIASAQSSWSALPSAVIGLASLAGVPVALGMVCGAMVARASLWAAASASKLLFK